MAGPAFNSQVEAFKFFLFAFFGLFLDSTLLSHTVKNLMAK